MPPRIYARAPGRGNAMAAGVAVTVAARLDRLPPSRHMRKLITLLSLGGWFEFYDLFFTAYVAIGLFKEGLFSPTTQGLFDLHGIASFVAAMFAGMFIGTLVFSWLSDRFGRRSIFTFALLWYSVGAFVMALQKNAGNDRSVALYRQHRARRRTGEYRRLFVGAGAERAARARLRLQPVHHVHVRADGGVPRLAIGAADDPRPRRLALGGHHRLHRRGVDLVDPPQPAGIAALAGPAWPHRRSRKHRRGHGTPHPRRNRARAAAAANRRRRSRAQGGRLDGDVESGLSRPHHHAGDLQSVPDDRLLRVLQLGAGALDLAGHRGHQVARLHFHYRGGGARSAR